MVPPATGDCTLAAKEAIDVTDDERPAAPADEAEPAGVTPPADEAAPADATTPVILSRPSGGGLRLLAAAVTLPWLLAYGVTGTWAVVRGARAFAAGLPHFDAGYTRPVTPAGLMYVGALLLAAFGVMLAAALLLLYARRSATVWLPLLLVAAGLTAGSVWAAVSGGLHPGFWLLFFFGLAYVVVVAAVRVVQVTRATRRGRIARP